MEYITSDADFKKKVLGSKRTVMVDFYADWCGPCQMMAPVFQEFSEENADVDFFKVNVDECPAPAQSLGIDVIPTVIVFKNGKETARATGMREKESLSEMIKR